MPEAWWKLLLYLSINSVGGFVMDDWPVTSQWAHWRKSNLALLVVAKSISLMETQVVHRSSGMKEAVSLCKIVELSCRIGSSGQALLPNPVTLAKTLSKWNRNTSSKFLWQRYFLHIHFYEQRIRNQKFLLRWKFHCSCVQLYFSAPLRFCTQGILLYLHSERTWRGHVS